MTDLEKKQANESENTGESQQEQAGKSNSKKLIFKYAFRLFWILILALLLVYFFAPVRTNILILGTDDSPERGEVGWTDTIILTTVVLNKPYVGLLSIPRDLWLPIPNAGNQPINNAYFLAEAYKRGTGVEAAVKTVQKNFDVQIDYHVLLHMQGVVDIVDALGGIDISLDKSRGGLPAGAHHLDGTQALDFVRDRYSGDDFSRMRQGQIVIQAVLKKITDPHNFKGLPTVWGVATKAIDSDIPAWQLPRLGFALLRSLFTGLDVRAIDRRMIVPVLNDRGAEVLSPRWDKIKPVLLEMFGE